MSHPDYKHIGKVHDRAMEECAELTLAICKALRFGWEGHNPHTPETTNRQRVLAEIMDFEDVLKTFKRLLRKAMP